MPKTADETPQRNLEEPLPEQLRESWVQLLTRRRIACRSNDAKKAEAEYQFGMGFVHALYKAELLRAGDRDDLRELLMSPNLRR
ncbi:hypothetical protein [Paucibacter sp. XJ19-41]|uniref:hypothetical protein n=1 Tax=Paucibacter sp. XJ19-41 TaxID=2927824 RepID=UPI00234BD81E|nr:hypothetical protein [Paucibacter sp. XJ19-41]MDC6171260.1 hypothetical protein [Paucibacter sp. XJ19-41]